MTGPGPGPGPGARRLEQKLTELAKARDDRPVGEVVAVSGGVATVRFLGVNRPMPRLGSYIPVVGHQVVLSRAGGRWVIDGQLAGIPT